MIIKRNEAQRLSSNAGRYGGIILSAFVQAVANDLVLVSTDLDRTQVNVQVTLNRGGNRYTIFNNNWQLLGTYKTRKNNYELFLSGQVYQYDTAGLPQTRLFTSYLPFACPVWVRGGDVLEVIITCGNDTFNTTNTAPASSFLDCILSPSNGVEFGVPSTSFEVVQTNSQSDTFVNASGISRIDFLCFNKADYSSITLNQLNLTSRQLNYAATQMELAVAEMSKYPYNPPYRYSTNDAIAPNNSVLRVVNWIPQSYAIYENRGGETLSDVVVAATFNSANVAASQNWFCYDQIMMDARTARNAIGQAQAQYASRARRAIGQ